ncbi:MAG TPA: SRPBCC domain-containing protein [Chitinophagaceae bacterium]
METKSNTKQAATTAKKELVIQRVFNLPLHKVWQAWTEPESYKKWWGPYDFTCPSATIDFRTGGKYLSCMRSSKGEEFWSTGVYKEIILNKKIVMSDNFSDAEGNIVAASAYNMPGEWPKELLITVSFEEADGATKMKLKHIGTPDEVYDECIKGWNESFDKLEKNIN